MNYLMQSGAEISAVCEAYRTPLHYAALYGSDELHANLLAKLGDDTSAGRRDLHGQSAVFTAEAGRSSHAHASEDPADNTSLAMVDNYGVLAENDDSDDDDIDDMEHTDIPMSLTGRNDLLGKSLSIKDLVTEENGGVEEIIAGTFDAIAYFLLRYEDYRMEELSALIWSCGYASNNGGGNTFQETVDILQNMRKQYSVGTEAGFYVRRMLLSALDKLVEILKHSVEMNWPRRIHSARNGSVHRYCPSSQTRVCPTVCKIFKCCLFVRVITRP
uniref:Uncharacterized protein n=1 Tax=Hyaloperonospora arabidopsidis (strain Emoy2) TaxID=559515 RepID=M4C6X7_HYAAE